MVDIRVYVRGIVSFWGDKHEKLENVINSRAEADWASKMDLAPDTNFIGMVKSSWLGWAGHQAQMDDNRPSLVL